MDPDEPKTPIEEVSEVGSFNRHMICEKNVYNRNHMIYEYHIQLKFNKTTCYFDYYSSKSTVKSINIFSG